MNRTALFFLLLAAVSLTSLACNPKKTSRTSSENGAERIEESDAAAEQLIQSVVNMLRGLPARNMYPTVAMQLNQYFARQGDNIRPLDQDVRQAAVTMLGPQALTELERELTVIDIDFLVSSLFFQTVNRILRSETYDELAYAEKLFEWVTRNVQVVPPGSLPMGTPMEVCIRGMASGQERAWIFLELLRQADLPGCVVAVAREDQPDNPIPWFCGVIINDEVHLFHPELGIPIPSAKNRIATLSEVAGDPEILKQLEQDLKSDYKVAPPENRYSLLVVIETPMLSPKMEFLQSRLTGEYRTNLYLDRDEFFTLAQKAIEKTPGGEGVRIWQRPSQVRHLLYTDNSFQTLFTDSLNRVWLQQADSPRLLQLRGEHDKAVEAFAHLDLNYRPEEMNEMLKHTAMTASQRGRLISETRQDIIYFGGLSQLGLSQPRPEIAAEWFGRYLNEYGSPLLHEDDVLVWGEFCERIAKEGKENQETVPGRLWRLMAEPARETMARIAAEAAPLRDLQLELQRQKLYVRQLREQLALVVAGAELGTPQEIEQELAVQTNDMRQKGEKLQESLSLNLSERKELVDAINKVLVRQDFYDPKSVPESIFPMEQRDELEKRREAMKPREWMRLNRMLLDRTFADEIARNLEKWFPGAVYHRAYALHLQGKTEEALQSIEEMLPELPELYQVCLRAQTLSWKPAGQ